MSTHFLNLAFKSAINKSSLKFILVALADYANEAGEAYPSTETLVNKTALNRKTILSGLQELREQGYISDTGFRRGETGQIKVWKLHLNSAEKGTIKEYQKRNSTKNGTVPFLPTKSPKNGTLKESQKRDIEPSVSLTISEPSEKEKTREKKFTPPAPEEVNDFAQANGLNLDGFFEYYGSNGWKVGRNPMKNWHLAAHGWHKRSKQFSPKQKQSVTDHNQAAAEEAMRAIQQRRQGNA